MKNILVPLPERYRAGDVLECAVGVARLFGSCIEGVAVAPDLSRTIAAEFPIDPHYIDPDNRRQIVADAHADFIAHMRGAGLSPYEASGGAPGYEWVNWELGEDSRVASYARVFDLVAIGRPSSAKEGLRLATVETILFESGRPVLLVPPGTGGTVGRTIVIAWNGSPETARAVAFAMPFLKEAGSIVVLSLEGWEVGGPGAGDLARRLARHGLPVEHVERPYDGSPGESIMKHARALGADLLVKGAYTQSRLRQMIFGGATSHLLSHSDVPMLIAH